MEKVMLAFILLTTMAIRHVHTLSIDFYSKRCPGAEKIISRIVRTASRRDPSVPAALLRLHYHDCFVGGCDASVLLDSGYGYPPPEKLAAPNQSLRGYELVDLIKYVLESTCPLTVSCADILALSARDAVVYAGGPHWKVPTGRRDSRLSSALIADMSLPHPLSSQAQLKRRFLQHGLSENELITLSGAHTIGLAHCTSVLDRLYNFRNGKQTDPSMDSNYAAQLKRICPRYNLNSKMRVPLDPVTPFKFDNTYYKNLEKGLGLLASDQIIHNKMAIEFGRNSTLWKDRFRKAMIHLSILNVKEDFQGEIRRNCRQRN